MTEKEQIIINAFYDELEKNAGWMAGLANFIPKILGAGKTVSTAAKAGTTLGQQISGGLNAAKSFASPEFVQSAAGTITQAAKNPAGNFVTTSLGNTARALSRVGTGLSTDKTLLQNASQFASNIGSIAKKQVMNARYRTVNANKIGEGKKWSLDTATNTLKSKYGFGSRKIVGKTEAGDFILKKRMPMQAIGIAATPVGFGATMAITDKNPVSGAKEFAGWTVAPQVMTAKLIADGIKQIKKPKNLGIEQQQYNSFN